MVDFCRSFPILVNSFSEFRKARSNEFIEEFSKIPTLNEEETLMLFYSKLIDMNLKFSNEQLFRFKRYIQK